MNLLFYFGHPAQYLFLRETIRRLSKSKLHKVTILIKTKDVLEQLLTNDGQEYINILPQERGKTMLSMAVSLLRRQWAMLPIVLKTKPDLMVSTDATIAQLGKLLRINRITITEDDYEVIKTLGDLSYPFTQTILCPEVCNVGKWGAKKIGYHGYMKLGYLHPNVFSLNESILKKYKLPEKYLIIRLSQLNAHHDFGIKGIDNSLLDEIISVANRANFRVFISSERKITDSYKEYEIKINPSDIHHILAGASILVCDSQSMTVEAAMLGIPSLRYSDFVGRISVLEELEHTYQLTYGIRTGNVSLLFERLNELLHIPNLKVEYQKRRTRMLMDKIDVTSFLVWFIEKYPQSATILKSDTTFQDKFK